MMLPNDIIHVILDFIPKHNHWLLASNQMMYTITQQHNSHCWYADKRSQCTDIVDCYFRKHYRCFQYFSEPEILHIASVPLAIRKIVLVYEHYDKLDKNVNLGSNRWLWNDILFLRDDIRQTLYKQNATVLALMLIRDKLAVHMVQNKELLQKMLERICTVNNVIWHYKYLSPISTEALISLELQSEKARLCVKNILLFRKHYNKE